MKFTLQHYDDFIGMILSLVAQHSKTPSVSHMDMVNSGIVGLIKAVNTWDPNKGKLASWCFLLIRSAIIKTRYKSDKERPEICFTSYATEINQETYDPPSEVSYTELPIMIEEDNQERRRMIKIIKLIINSPYTELTKDNQLNRRIYKDRMDGMKIKDIANKYNLTYLTTMHRINKITNLIRQELKTKGVTYGTGK